MGGAKTRAEAGMTDASAERDEQERWGVRLAGLEPLASPQLLSDAICYAIEAAGDVAGVLRHKDAATQLESIDNCAEGFAVQFMRARLAGGLEAELPTRAHVGYQEVMATARVREIATRRVAELRKEVFGSAQVPFATLAEATDWIEQEQKRAGNYSDEESRELLAAYRKIGIELTQLGYRGRGYRHDYLHPFLRYFATRHGAGVRYWEVGKSVPLLLLHYGQGELVRDLLVEEWQTADFVLFGVPPAVPRYSIIWRDRSVSDPDASPREIVRASWIELRIHDRFFSYEDIREVFRYLATSGFLLSRKSPAQLAKLQRLQRFVDERRPPGGWRGGALHKARPWRQVASEWNDANPEARYSLSGIQKAYKEASNYFSGAPTSASRHRGRRPPGGDVGRANSSPNGAGGLPT